MKATMALAGFALLAGTSARGEPHETPGSPAADYAAVMADYRPASGALRAAETDLQRKEAVERMASFPARFVEVADRHPTDPIALEALRQAVQAVSSTDSAALITWELNQSEFPAGCTDGSAARIVALLRRDHLRSDQLGPLCDRMRYSYRMESARCLRSVLDENPHREVQARACLFLAQFLNDRAGMLRLSEERPELIECYRTVFGARYLEELREIGQPELERRAEVLFERAAREFATVEVRGRSVGELARAGLFELRNLAVGKLAPAVEGPDQDGVPFTLADYRGKVVLLYFWSDL